MRLYMGLLVGTASAIVVISIGVILAFVPWLFVLAHCLAVIYFIGLAVDD